jgi:hypothetical protein
VARWSVKPRCCRPMDCPRTQTTPHDTRLFLGSVSGLLYGSLPPGGGYKTRGYSQVSGGLQGPRQPGPVPRGAGWRA